MCYHFLGINLMYAIISVSSRRQARCMPETPTSTSDGGALPNIPRSRAHRAVILLPLPVWLLFYLSGIA
jgi:hypothetical protein